MSEIQHPCFFNGLVTQLFEVAAEFYSKSRCLSKIFTGHISYLHISYFHFFSFSLPTSS